MTLADDALHPNDSYIAAARAGPPPKPSQARIEGRGPTLDDLIRDDTIRPRPRPPELAGFGDRLDWTRLGLVDLIGQIRQRYHIYNAHFSQLADVELAARRARLSWFDPYDAFEGDPDFAGLMRDLRAQRRDLQLNLWRDVSRLRQAVPPWVRDYLQAARRYELLGDSTATGGRYP